MPSYVALLRGVNLGAHNRVAMAELRRVLTDAGFSDVATHLQSGNAIFGARQRSGASVEKAVEKLLRGDLELDIDVMVRTAAELASVVEGTPYPAGKTLYVAFLKSEPPTEVAGKLEPTRFEPERFELRGRELYLHYPDGYGRSKMSGAYFERVLKVPATVRNWNVTSALAELAAR